MSTKEKNKLVSLIKQAKGKKVFNNDSTKSEALASYHY